MLAHRQVLGRHDTGWLHRPLHAALCVCGHQYHERYYAAIGAATIPAAASDPPAVKIRFDGSVCLWGVVSEFSINSIPTDSLAKITSACIVAIIRLHALWVNNSAPIDEQPSQFSAPSDAAHAPLC